MNETMDEWIVKEIKENQNVARNAKITSISKRINKCEIKKISNLKMNVKMLGKTKRTIWQLKKLITKL